jgi:chromosomal replication initiation ATPase DnaA
MALLRAILGKELASLSEIGRYFGRNHATVKHAVEIGSTQQLQRDDRLKAAAHATSNFFRR